MGLCFNCDEKYTDGHQCKSKFLLLLGTDNDNDPDLEYMEEIGRVEQAEVLLCKRDVSILYALVRAEYMG
ncbi:hypothetical protein PTKIN_Ptkin06aG0116200 [Pterospermum kingtungense]